MPGKPQLAPQEVSTEMRLIALEYLFANMEVRIRRLAVGIGVPESRALSMQEEMLAKLSVQRFEGVDPAMADHAADELYLAVKRLVDMTNEMYASLPDART